MSVMLFPWVGRGERVNVSNAPPVGWEKRGWLMSVMLLPWVGEERVNVSCAPPGGGRGTPYVPPALPWWPYYTGVYGPASLPGWTSVPMLHAEHERWSARRAEVRGDSPCGSEREIPMGGRLSCTSGS